ncbi:MAG TPA: adenylate/guanylate cyclase domain-containing protein [Usitatibacter sp.]|jgi:class 3 adenylate cyclase|nr:adenylate/guanylate cyclase domain-containing protein [Usitatibacter sp.]
MLDQANRTFICSVVFIDLVGYSKKPVTEQIRLKTSLTNNLSEAIKDIPVNDRIILDTGDGAAISFLGDPEDALFVTLSLREAMMREGMTSTMVEASGEDSVRMGINLGPVKLVKDINGHPNIIGDGINVAQRIMSFARPGQIVVSRSYYDVVSNLASEYAKLFHYEGSRTDKHVREHEIYVVGHHEGALQKARDGMKDRASSTSPNRKSRNGTSPGTNTVTLTIPSFVQDKKKLTLVAGGLAALVLVLGVLVIAKKPSSSEALRTAAAPPPVITPVKPAAVAAAPATGATTEPSKPGEPTSRPAIDSNVVLPQPSPSQVPPAKPEPSKSEAAKPETIRPESTKNNAHPNEATRDARPASEKPANGVIPATLFFNVTPWGEIFVNGKSQGVTPPKKSLKLDPGKYRIEIRNTTFPPHAETLELKARDEVTVRHKFQ